MPQDKPYIERLELSGFKSIRQATVDFGKLNVLIGANGAGKSNLISYFALLRDALDAKLDDHVARQGGPNALLHLGVKQTSEIREAVHVRTPAGRDTLFQRLEFRAPDRLVYSSNHSGRPPRPGHGPDGMFDGGAITTGSSSQTGSAGADSDEVIIDGFCSIVRQNGAGYPHTLIFSR